MFNISCKKHGTDITDTLRCPQCLEENIKAYNEAYKGMNVTVSLPPSTGKTVLVNGKEEYFQHNNECIEYGGIPTEIYEEIYEYIEKRIREYENKCMCALCQRNRIENEVKI